MNCNRHEAMRRDMKAGVRVRRLFVVHIVAVGSRRWRWRWRWRAGWGAGLPVMGPVGAGGGRGEPMNVCHDAKIPPSGGGAGAAGTTGEAGPDAAAIEGRCCCWWWCCW